MWPLIAFLLLSANAVADVEKGYNASEHRVVGLVR